MKFQKILLFTFFVLALMIGVRAQDKESATRSIVESGQFVFHAQTALPMSGSSRQLTSEYDVKVSKDAVVSYLPFFGRAYSLPYGSSEGGFNFTSRKFDYSISDRKKGGWQINIRPRDVADFRHSRNLQRSCDGVCPQLEIRRRSRKDPGCHSIHPVMEAERDRTSSWSAACSGRRTTNVEPFPPPRLCA